MKTPRRTLRGLGLVVLSVAGLAAADPHPRLVLDERVQDLGTVGVGESAAHDFSFRNDGAAPLKVEVAEAARGITATVDPREVAPGGHGRVRVVADSERLGGPLVLITALKTNDPDQPELTLELRLAVRPFLQVQPGYARWITVQQAREGTIAQTVGATDGATFRVTHVESPLPHLRIVYGEARPEERRAEWSGSQWRIEATLASDSPVGPVSGAIVVTTNHARQKRVEIPIGGFVRPIFAITPPEMRLDELDPTRTRPLVLLVKNFAEEPIDLAGASVDVPGFRAEIEAVDPGRSYRLQLLVDPAAAPGPFRGTIRLRTVSKKLPFLEVPLSGRIVASPAR